MTKKDFELLAQALSDSRPPDLLTAKDKRDTWYKTVTAISQACAKQNTLFNFTRFFDACGVPD